MPGWWVGKVRQARRHVLGRVSDAERDGLATWLSPAQVALFGRMHRADQRHGLDVVGALRNGGQRDPELLLAGLFHDASKGPGVRLPHRVAWSLGERYGPRVLRATSWLPGFSAAFERIREHPEASATLALEAGCSPATAELIRHQAAPLDPVAGEALRLADEAS